jgi:S1-C subfamily serine protease
VHRNYPANKSSLAGKVGKPADFPVPEKIPGLTDKGSKAATRQNCIHCHMVREYALRAKWLDRKLTLEDLWVFPMPNRIGLRMDDKDGLKIQSVAADSPAARAGIQPGDELVRLNGQPLLSIADIQWMLHNVPAETTLKATVQRQGSTLDKDLALTGNWKESDIAWRASSWYGLRQGLKTEPLSDADKEKRGIPANQLALAVRGLFGKGAPKLQQAGLKTGDVIVAMDGKSAPMNESQFLIDLRLRHGPDESVRFTVLRGDQRLELTVPLW